MIRRMFRMQTNQDINASPNSDFQRLLVALQNWWSLVSRQLDQDFTDLQEQISAIPVATTKSQEFTAGGTFTAPHSGYFDFLLQAGGGGSGGAQTAGDNANIARSGGAGAGQQVNVRLHMTAGSVATYVIGAAGAAGAATAGAGGNGGDTTLTYGGVVYRARGGLGSAGVLASGVGITTNGVGARGGQSVPDATPGRSALLIAGNTFDGANGHSAAQANAGGACGSFAGGSSGATAAGGGGATSFGAGGNGATTNGVGQIGQGYGAGAGGSIRSGSVGTQVGAAGAAGFGRAEWIG